MTLSSNNLLWVAVTYPQDFSFRGASLGPQTILRLQRLVDAKHAKKIKISHVILACGMCPNKKKFPLQTHSFASMMQEWLIHEGTFSREQILCSDNHKVWNCIEVTLEMIRMIRHHQLPENVLIVSTGFHIFPRMWITWRLLTSGKSWSIGAVPEWTGTYGIIHELFGTIKYIPMALWYRWVRRIV